MSRSFKKHSHAPYCGNTSQKRDKRICNRIMRRINRILLNEFGEEATFIYKEEALDEWDMPQDGSMGYRPYVKYQSKMTWNDWYKWVKGK